jgi:hypothetical protein
VKRITTFASVGLFLTTINLSCFSKDPTLEAIRRMTHKKIVRLAKEPIIVNAVKEANKEARRSLDEIMQLDKKWQATERIDEWIGGFLNNPCADYLKKIQMEASKDKRSLYAEIFVMDKQGCIVAESDKTSDYWQGDEDKFINSFADGAGAVFIDKPSLDKSTNRYLIQVSVPILDPNTKKAIGAMTVRIDMDLLVAQESY